MKKIALIITLLSFQYSIGQNIFQDDFNSYATGVPLSGQGLWTNVTTAPNVGYGPCSGLGCTSANVVPQAMSYLNYGNTSKVLKIDGIKDGIGHPINPVITGGDFYVSFVLNITTAPVSETPNDFFRVNNSALSEVTFRLLVKDDVFGYKIGIRKGPTSSTTVYATDSYNFNENYLIVLKYSHQPLTNDDIVTLYVNPVFENGEPTVPTAVTTAGFDQSGLIDRLGFRLNQNVFMPSGFAGLVSASSTWFGLGFLPLGTNSFDSSTIQITSSQVNPAILNVNSKTDLNNVKLSIFDLQGRELENKLITLNSNLNQININPIQSKGVYIVHLSSENQKFTQKISVN